ncbi:histone-lysine N-methyltransferase NSD2 [Neodiprion fabricii]|uniref:histone-lysine N-methyltransferase NSD2 n=1 Tax=Neodiprion fabricii TaxID=2872261 RepID=UPI001ED921CA|nr:histone-lysine N-methyltransferase NSD2 [Neodiprion fabricii]XP_046412949.1 histone-lysine N-methyltransferase NSD2 [Neodiprion fabricii]XP_046412950.1 histone-lysine N-methyltransferase NSD2 [Neodiprion fabricii]
MSAFNAEGPKEASTNTTKNFGSTVTGSRANDSTKIQDSSDTVNGLKDSKSVSYSPNTSRYGRTIKSKLHGSMPSSDYNLLSNKQELSSQSINGNGGGISKKIFQDQVKSVSNPSPGESFDSTLNLSRDSSNLSTDMECNWLLGQLAWARIGTFPFWPCVVTLEPVTMIYHKVLRTGRAQQLGIHVQYFGDKGRHNWVKSHYMIPFSGIKNFETLAESLTPEVKKKDPKYAAAFIVKSGMKPKWDKAVSEATDVLSMTNEQRAEVFKPPIKLLRSVTTEVPKTNTKEKIVVRKRKLSPDDKTSPKRMKAENAESEVDTDEKLEKPKSRKQRREHNENKADVNLSANTPPTPPSSHKDSSDEAPLPKKPKTKKLKKIVEGDFEIYFERNRDRIQEEQPDASESEIRRYLKKTWGSMNIVSKSSYQVRLKQKNSSQVKGRRLIKESFSSSDDETEEVNVSLEEEEIFTINKKLKSSVEKPDPGTTENANGKKKRLHNLFKGMKQERVCQICEKSGKLTRCRGPCYSYFHLSCVKPGESSPENSIDGNTTEDELFDNSRDAKEISGEEDENNQEEVETNDKTEEKSDDPVEQSEEEAFKCIDCLSGVAPACFICNEREGDRIRCTVFACGKHYHSACLKPWPQSHWQGGRLYCPYHVCHTCSSDNPRDSNHLRSPNEKLVRCVRCPSSYHPSITCLPAGSGILTGSQIICPKHYKAPHPPLNAAWCFLCTQGGSLICCDTCPTSFHPECLGIDAPDGAFICEDCETGRLPLYGEVTWVKLGNYRWWPSIICYPHEIPHNVLTIPHTPGEFCVMFLGTKNYYWVHRGRAFLYQDGDANTKTSTGKKYVDEAYRKALEEAQEMHLRLKIERAAAVKENGPKDLKPPHYVKLKVNKPVGNVKPVEVESIAACDCDADWDNPCAPETDCLNRILSVECSSGMCPAGPKCGNQAFVRRQYPSMIPFHTAGRGWGLKALETIKSGQFVVEYVGEVIDEAEYKRRLQRKKELKDENFYFLTIDNFRMIDAEPKGNLSRFMNHSCQPNCETQKWTVNGDTRIGLFALRDIEIGEELTFNYNLACDGETRKPCLCGSPNCSGFIGLKAPKLMQQLNTAQEKKISKQKRSGKVKSCWTCGNKISDDDLLQCDQKTCGKRYHKSCVTFEDTDSRFSCPWHHCAACSRRTSAHCSFCSTAFCQIHIEGKLTEYGDKGGFTCNSHGTIGSDNNESDNDTETEKAESPIEFSSPLISGNPPTRDPSPRVSIIEVHGSSEEGEESQKEDEDEQAGNGIQPVSEVDKKKISKKKTPLSRRFSVRKQRQEEAAKTLSALTSSQLEAIIGGSVLNGEKNY